MNKDQIRSKMPPTTRNFEVRTDRIAERVDRIESMVTLMKTGHEFNDAIIASNSEYTLFASLEALRNTDDRPPRILLAGWYGAQNCGDELMMQTVLGHLPESVRANTTVLLWNDEDYPLGNIDPLVRILHYPPTTYGIQALADLFDVLVWGGGAIIDDVQYDERPSNHATGNLFIRLSDRMIAQGKNVFCLSLSASDSIEKPDYLAQLQNVIDRSVYFSLRDPYSRDTLEQAGIDISRIKLDADIVFANKKLHRLAEQRKSAHLGNKMDSIGLVLHCFEGMEDFNYQLIRDVAAITRKQDGTATNILLVPFYNEKKSDERYLNSLASRYREERPASPALQIAPYTDDLDATSLLACDLVISCRYHASLIAGCLGIPFVAICNDAHKHYPNKTKYLIEQLYPERPTLDRMVCTSDYSKEKLESAIALQRQERLNPCIATDLFEEESKSLISVLSSLPTN